MRMKSIILVLVGFVVLFGCDHTVGVFSSIAREGLEDDYVDVVEEPEVVESEPEAEEPEIKFLDPSDTVYDYNEYVAIDDVIRYIGDYTSEANIVNTGFYITPNENEKVVASVDFILDMTSQDLSSLRGERVKFSIFLNGLEIHYKARIPADTGNKYIGIFGDRFTNYMTSAQVWYNLTMDIFEDGRVDLYYNGNHILTTKYDDLVFDTFMISYVARTNGNKTPSMGFRNISVSLEDI